MHCPKCGKEVRVSLVCPNCGEELKQQGPPPRLPDEPSVGIPRGVILVIILIIGLAVGYFFLQSSVYLKVKARGLIGEGEYAAAIDILDDIIDKTGPEPDLVELISEAMLLQAGERMDDGDYREAIPVLNNVIEYNMETVETDLSEENLLNATYDKAICYLNIAQEEGKHITPFGKELTDAAGAVEKARELLTEVDAEWVSEMKADLHMVASTIALERASFFNHVHDKSQARTYVIEAEEELNNAIAEAGNKEKFTILSYQISQLKGVIYN